MSLPLDPAKIEQYKQNIRNKHLGKPLSDETKQKMSLARKGKKRKPFSEEHLKHLSEAHKGINLGKKRPPRSEEWNRKQSEAHKGQNLGGTMPPRSEEWIKKQRESHLGNKASDETKQKMSATRKGVPKTKEHKQRIADGQTGCKQTTETKLKIAIVRHEKYSRENHPGWKGGISYLPYCYKFNYKRKCATRTFFGNNCICCGKTHHENITLAGNYKALSVHHINHNKDEGCNGLPFNLVPLCSTCHGKELYKEQDYKNYINKTLQEGFKWGIWSEQEYMEKVMYSE